LLALLGGRPLGINLYRRGMIKGCVLNCIHGALDGRGMVLLGFCPDFGLLSCCLDICMAIALHCMAWLAPRRDILSGWCVCAALLIWVVLLSPGR
jgi:hypothetical protein